MRIKMTPEEARDFARWEALIARANEAKVAMAAAVSARLEAAPDSIAPDIGACEWIVPDPPEPEKPAEPEPAE